MKKEERGCTTPLKIHKNTTSEENHTNKQSGKLIVAISSIHGKGKAYKLYLPHEISSFLVEQRIHRVKLITDSSRGLIALIPLRDSELDGLYKMAEGLVEVVK